MPEHDYDPSNRLVPLKEVPEGVRCMRKNHVVPDDECAKPCAACRVDDIMKMHRTIMALSLPLTTGDMVMQAIYAVDAMNKKLYGS